VEEKMKIVERMLKECFSSSALSSDSAVEATLLCNVSLATRNYDYENPLVFKAQAFRYGPIIRSVHSNVTTLFSIGQISYYVDCLFWGYLSVPDDCKSTPKIKALDTTNKRFLGVLFKLSDKTQTEMESFFNSSTRLMKCDIIRGRYCPAVLFFSEGFSKVLTLV